MHLVRRGSFVRLPHTTLRRLLYTEKRTLSTTRIPLQVYIVYQKRSTRENEERLSSLWTNRQYGLERHFPRCLALSHAADSHETLWKTIRQWIRVAIHLGKLLCLAIPLTITAPVVLSTRRFLPSIEEQWWEYALWAAQFSSPAVMKFLQWASTRRDMFPASFCDRFDSFLENAPRHSWRQTEDALTLALGADWKSIIDLDREPIGSGCIAQVYRGRLRASGEEVAVKVIHPHVKHMIEIDLNILRGVVTLLEMIPHLRWLGARESLEEFASLMNRQLNLRVEADNLLLFAKHFRHRKGLRFPKPHMEYTSESVLVESFEKGMHFHEILSDIDASRRKAAAQVVLESYLRMVFLDNFAHGDLHPGNLLFDIHTPTGSATKPRGGITGVVAIDAGIVTKLEPDDLRNFVELFHAVATGNGYKAGELIVSRSQPRDNVALNASSPQLKCKDLESFCEGMERIVSNALSWKLKLDKVHVGALLREVMELCWTHEVKLEGKYASIVVSIAVLEAVGRKLDPDIDILNVALPIIAQSLVKNVRQL